MSKATLLEQYSTSAALIPTPATDSLSTSSSLLWNMLVVPHRMSCSTSINKCSPMQKKESEKKFFEVKSYLNLRVLYYLCFF